jgi:hypothetical protein
MTFRSGDGHLFTLVLEDEAMAWGFAHFGERNVALPGQYIREPRGLWVNDVTGHTLAETRLVGR